MLVESVEISAKGEIEQDSVCVYVKERDRQIDRDKKHMWVCECVDRDRETEKLH